MLVKIVQFKYAFYFMDVSVFGFNRQPGEPRKIMGMVIIGRHTEKIVKMKYINSDHTVGVASYPVSMSVPDRRIQFIFMEMRIHNYLL
jgi:hypothetical protein